MLLHTIAPIKYKNTKNENEVAMQQLCTRCTAVPLHLDTYV